MLPNKAKKIIHLGSNMRENYNTFSSDEGRWGEGEAAGEPRRTKLMRGEATGNGGARNTPVDGDERRRTEMNAGDDGRRRWGSTDTGCAAKGSIVKTESLG